MRYDLLILGVVAIATLFFQQWLHIKERSSLLDRIMSNNYQEFNYYKKMFEGEVEELKEQRDTAKKEDGEDAEIKKEMDLEYTKEKEFMKGTEEDWDEEEIDFKKLRERIPKD